jgi:hypothetical protein
MHSLTPNENLILLLNEADFCTWPDALIFDVQTSHKMKISDGNSHLNK